MKLEVNGGAELARLVELFNVAAKGNARQAMSRGLNDEADKGRTQIRRALVAQSGMKYGWVARGMKTRRSTSSTLAYAIGESGSETNLNLFGARQLMAGVNAKPWNRGRLFQHAFLVKSRGWKVYAREGKDRVPIRQLWGPNLGREVVKDQSREAFEAIGPKLAPAVLRLVAHEFGL
jgi:hypothetical protein